MQVEDYNDAMAFILIYKMMQGKVKIQIFFVHYHKPKM